MSLCIDCGDPIPKSTMVNGKRKSLRNRSRCLRCVPFGTSPYSQRLTDDERLRTQRTRGARKQRIWRADRIRKTGLDPILIFRTRRKKAVVDLLGGGCQICGYCRHIRNMVFHHVRDKVFGLSERGFQFSAAKLLPELRKTILVCQNCHGEIHGGLIDDLIVRSLNKDVCKVLAGGLTLPTSKLGPLA